MSRETKAGTLLIPFIVKNCPLDRFFDEQYFQGADLKKKDKWFCSIKVNENLFGGENNYQLEKKYFYLEVFETLYNPEKARTYIYIWKEEKNFTIRIENLEVMLQKMYFFLTRTGTAMMVMELHPDWINDSKWNQFDELGAIKIMETLFGFQKHIYYPFGEQIFKASYILDNEKTVDVPRLHISKYHLSISNPVIDETILVDFFAHYMTIYMICVIQKTEILRISEIAGYLPYTHDMKKTEELLENYIDFLNQYDFLECTHKEEGQRFYKEIRDIFDLEKQTERIKEQIEMLNNMQLAKKEEKENNILFKLSIIAILSVLEDGTNFFMEILAYMKIEPNKTICEIILLICLFLFVFRPFSKFRSYIKRKFCK